MLGQVSQNTTPPPERPKSLAEKAFEQRTAGPYSYRYTTPLGYSFMMFIMRNWRVKEPITIKSDAQPRKGLPSALTVPATLDNAEDKAADDWVRDSQREGYGVIALPSTDYTTSTIVRTRRAAVAQDLTAKNESWAVLSEPKEGWIDVLTPTRLLAFPVFLAVGIIGVLAATEAIR